MASRAAVLANRWATGLHPATPTIIGELLGPSSQVGSRCVWHPSRCGPAWLGRLPRPSARARPLKFELPPGFWVVCIRFPMAVLPRTSDIDAIAGPRLRLMRSTEFARKLGISGRTVRRAYARGSLPGAVEHGPRLLMVPTHLLRLATAYGLRGVENMVKAGLLS